MMEVVVITGAMASNYYHQQTNTQFFTGWMPFLLLNQQCQSTEGKPMLKTICIKIMCNITIIDNILPSASRASTLLGVMQSTGIPKLLRVYFQTLC